MVEEGIDEVEEEVDKVVVMVEKVDNVPEEEVDEVVVMEETDSCELFITSLDKICVTKK